MCRLSLVLVLSLGLSLAKSQGSFRIIDSNHPTEIYRAPANQGRPSYIITAKEPEVIGSNKPDWNDRGDPLEDDNLQYHTFDCGPGRPCSQTIEIPEEPVKKPWYIQDRIVPNPVQTNPDAANLVKKIGHFQQRQFKPEPVFQPDPQPYFDRYDPFAYHTKHKKYANVPPTARSPEPPATLYHQEPTTYHSHYTDSRLFAGVTQSPYQTTALMRPSLTWKSPQHKQKHLASMQQNTWASRKYATDPYDYNDYDVFSGKFKRPTTSRPKRHNNYFFNRPEKHASTPGYFPTTPMPPWQPEPVKQGDIRRGGPYFPVKPTTEEPEIEYDYPRDDYSAAKPAVLNTAYMVADDETDSDIWTSYDERYGWSKDPADVSTKAPIKTWTALEVAKPDWNEEQTAERAKDQEQPYGKWKAGLNLHAVPFSRSTDGKRRWVKMASGKQTIATTSGTDVITEKAVPFKVVPARKRKRKRLSKRLKLRKVSVP